MKKLFITTSTLLLALTATAQTNSEDVENAYPGYKLVFHDEFDKDGRPDPDIWRFETGFVRNHEAQYYQADNATVKDGNLVIEAHRESVKNDKYVAGSSDWKKKDEYSTYTSASMVSRGKTSGDAVSRLTGSLCRMERKLCGKRITNVTIVPTTLPVTSVIGNLLS